MGTSVRKFLAVGVATVTAAAAIAFVPPDRAVPVAAPTQVVRVVSTPVALTAVDLPNLLVGFLQHYAVPPSAGAPFPTPHFPPVVAPTSIGSSIIWIYNAVEPWVRYGFELATYAVGWVPYVGWLSGQIMIFYNFGERIARSITYNIAYWLDGNISFGQGLVNVGVDTVNAFIQLGIDQWNFWLWPLPPLPPIFPGTALAATTELATTAAVTEDATVTENATLDQKLKKKDREALGDVIAAEEATQDGQEPAVEAVKEAKEPKTPKTTPSAAVAAQGEVRGAQTDETTEAKKVPNGNGHKKGDESQTADATSGPSASGATNDGTGAKHDKKDETGKKDKTE